MPKSKEEYPGGKVWPPFDKGHNVPGAGTMGMWIFLSSLSTAFIATILGYWYLRYGVETWRPPELESLPSSLWFSTAVLAGLSFFAELARQSILRDGKRAMRVSLLAVLALGLVFTIAQGFGWAELMAQFKPDDPNMAVGTRMFTVTFYLLTGMHALHVLGGLVMQGVVVYFAQRDEYWSYHHPGVRYAAMYWHFLGVVWVAILATLYFGS